MQGREAAAAAAITEGWRHTRWARGTKEKPRVARLEPEVLALDGQGALLLVVAVRCRVGQQLLRVARPGAPGAAEGQHVLRDVGGERLKDSAGGKLDPAFFGAEDLRVLEHGRPQLRRLLGQEERELPALPQALRRVEQLHRVLPRGGEDGFRRRDVEAAQPDVVVARLERTVPFSRRVEAEAAEPSTYRPEGEWAGGRMGGRGLMRAERGCRCTIQWKAAARQQPTITAIDEGGLGWFVGRGLRPSPHRNRCRRRRDS